MGRCVGPVTLVLGDPSPGLALRLDHAPCGLSLELEQVQRVAVPVASEDTYEGPYEVTPKTEAQTLPTAKKVMTDDVTVKSVPYYETNNSSGGLTVYIASEV